MDELREYHQIGRTPAQWVSSRPPSDITTPATRLFLIFFDDLQGTIGVVVIPAEGPGSFIRRSALPPLKLSATGDG
jgi:hypothetical protein